MSQTSKKPRYIKPPNLLKKKMGAGGIDQKLIQKAQEMIETYDVDFVPFARNLLEDFRQPLKILQSKDLTDKQERNAAKEAMTEAVMQLKANGGMFRYPLITHVADIALDFLENIEDLNADGLEVLKAHERTLEILVNKQFKGDGGPAGRILLHELEEACRRYHERYKQTLKNNEDKS